MELFGHKPNKRNGQNFLVHTAAAEKFIETAFIDPQQQKAVVEIGPGLGAITLLLCQRYQQVYAIEKDQRLVKLWESKIGKPENLTLIHADATQYDFSQLASRLGERLVIFGNLPFNVSTIILIHLLNNWQHVRYAHLTFQKEVAQRLIAKPATKDYGSLTLLTQIFSDPIMRLHLSKHQYFPVPKVDSQVVGINFLEQPRVMPHDLKTFTSMLRKLYLYRRKTLLNGLKLSKTFKDWQPTVKQFLKLNQLPETVRVETLELNTLYRLYLAAVQGDQ